MHYFRFLFQGLGTFSLSSLVWTHIESSDLWRENLSALELEAGHLLCRSSDKTPPSVVRPLAGTIIPEKRHRTGP